VETPNGAALDRFERIRFFDALRGRLDARPAFHCIVLAESCAEGPRRDVARVITLGIDLSSMPKDTAICRIVWSATQAVAEPPEVGCDDARLDAAVAAADVVGIDAPLGWPSEFVAAVGGWTETVWDESVRDRMRFRASDRWLKERFGLTPLSVSTDLIALPAMRAMALLRRHGVADRSGDERFYEVYPGGSLSLWQLPRRGYKPAGAVSARREILQRIREALPWLKAPEECAATADGLDALLAALSVRAAAQGRSHRPPSELQAAARCEGWIHLPSGWPTPDGISPGAV
jgi:predicted nuclease with RNAse H fold